MTWPAALASLLVAAPAAGGNAVRLAVPVIEQVPERCGPASLAMVMRFYGDDSAAVKIADCGYEPVLRGALITELARCARSMGFASAVETPSEDSLRALLRMEVPPVLLYRRGIGPVSRGHYAVLVGWDPAAGRYALNDGGREPRTIKRGELLRRWKAAGSRALVVRRKAP